MPFKSTAMRLAVATTLLILLALVALMIGVTTAPGSAILVSALSKALGANVEIHDFEGRLSKRFSIASLSIKFEQGIATISSLNVEWVPGALINKKLLIQHVNVDRIALTAEPLQADDAPAPRFEIPTLPITIALQGLSIAEASITLGKQTYLLSELMLRLDWQDFGITLENLALKYANHTLLLNAQALNTIPISLDGVLEWSGSIDQAPSKASLDFSGPINSIEFALNTRGFIQTTAKTLIDLTDPLLPFSATINHGEKFLSPDAAFRVDSGTLSVSGNLEALEFSYHLKAMTKPEENLGLTVNGTATGFTNVALGAKSDLTWQITHPLLPDAKLRGHTNLELIKDRLQLINETFSPSATHLKATLAPTNLEENATATLSWEKIALPIAGVEGMVADNGSITFNGTASAANVALESSWSSSKFGSASVALAGVLASQQFDITSGIATLLNGKINYTGDVVWRETPTANLRLEAHQLNIGVINPVLQTQLDAMVLANVLAPSSGIVANVDLKRLSGKWREQEIEATAKFRIAPEQIGIEGLTANLGRNQISASLALDQNLSGKYIIEAPDLSQILSSLGGSITGAGQIAGSAKYPLLAGKVNADRLQFNAWSLDSLTIDYDVNASSSAQSSIVGTLDGLRKIGDKNLAAKGSFRAAGNSNAHRAYVSFATGYGKVATEIDGRWGNDVWDAGLTTLKITNTDVGDWALAKPASFSLSASGEFQLKSHLCIEQSSSALCINQAQHSRSRTLLNGILSSIPIALMNPWLPTNIKAQGALNSDFDIDVNGDKVSGTGKYNIVDGYLSTLIDDETDDTDAGIRRIAIDNFSGKFNATSELAKVEMTSQLGDWMNMNLDAAIPFDNASAMRANVEGTSENIEWLSEFVPALAGSTGTIAFSGLATGSRGNPKLSMDVGLKSGQLVVPDAGLHFTAVDVSLRNQGENDFVLDLIAKPQKGEIKVAGKVTHDTNKKWPFDMKVAGDTFSAARLPDLEIDITPDLHISGTSERVAVSGSVDIPHFVYSVNSIPKSAVRESADTVIVTGEGDNKAVNEAAPSWLDNSLLLDVDVTLGENVTASGLGLFTRLAGKVNVSKILGEEIKGNGTVLIPQGNFDAYGHALSITDGRMMFAGPITNPTLDIRAVRDNIPIVAGVAISGTARAPKFDVFSDPVLPDTDTLAYVVTGRPLGEGNSSDAALISQAALGLGLEQSSIITNRIRDLFGLDEFGLSSGGDIDQTALAAGKQLTPKVSVRTEMNILDQVWSFFLRYKLSEQWAIEAESGERQGADIIYNIEREDFEGFNPLR